MTILRFDGFVDVDDETVRIGGRDVIDEIEDVSWRQPYGTSRADGIVSVCLMDERFDGLLHAMGGSTGYSEWTPAEPAEFTVGGHNVFLRLNDLEGKQVTLIVADEPANVLDQGTPEPPKTQVRLLGIVAQGGDQGPLNECVNPRVMLDLLAVADAAQGFITSDNDGPSLGRAYATLEKSLQRLDFSKP